jgi:hypothetical protein
LSAAKSCQPAEKPRRQRKGQIKQGEIKGHVQYSAPLAYRAHHARGDLGGDR